MRGPPLTRVSTAWKYADVWETASMAGGKYWKGQRTYYYLFGQLQDAKVCRSQFKRGLAYLDVDSHLQEGSSWISHKSQLCDCVGIFEEKHNFAKTFPLHLTWLCFPKTSKNYLHTFPHFLIQLHNFWGILIYGGPILGQLCRQEWIIDPQKRTAGRFTSCLSNSNSVSDCNCTTSR